MVDLAVFTSVKAFVDRARNDLKRLDILLLNAAVATDKYEVTTDGWEQTYVNGPMYRCTRGKGANLIFRLQVNDLSPSLLAILLLPHLKETAKQYRTVPRLVLVSSDVHYWTKIEGEALSSSNTFEVLGSEEYCTPK